MSRLSDFYFKRGDNKKKEEADGEKAAYVQGVVKGYQKAWFHAVVVKLNEFELPGNHMADNLLGI